MNPNMFLKENNTQYFGNIRCRLFFLNDKSDPVSVINQANDKMLQLNGPVAMLVSKIPSKLIQAMII